MQWPGPLMTRPGTKTSKFAGPITHKMDKHELENWQKIRAALEASGKTDSHFYRRSVAILSGQGDYMQHPPLDQKEL